MNSSPYSSPEFRNASGSSLHPGGLGLTRKALDLCGWPDGCVVADVGCGIGATLKLLLDMGFDAIGFDVSRAMAREAADLAHSAVVVADAHALPLKNGALDGIVCECVLSLADDPEAVAAEFSRVLIPGGGLLLGDVCRADEAETTAMLEDNGFNVRHVMHDDEAVTRLAAQLLWHGCDRDRLDAYAGSNGVGEGIAPFYGIWIADKKS